MPREKGHEKTGGIKKGGHWKIPSSKSTFERLAFNGLETAIEIFRDSGTPIALRVALLKEILKYQYPTLKSIEIRQGDEITALTGYGDWNACFSQQNLARLATSAEEDSA